MGVMTRLPYCLVTPGGVEIIDVWARSPFAVSGVLHGLDGERLRRLARRALSRAWVLNGRFSFLCGISSEVPNRSPCSFNL
jgi:hypothetical protein